MVKVGYHQKPYRRIITLAPEPLRECRCGRWQQFRRLRLPLTAPEFYEWAEDAGHRRRAGLLPKPDQGHLHLRLRRHSRHRASGQDAHAGPHLHPARRRSTPAVCATTAWHRRYPRWSSTATSKRAPSSSSPPSRPRCSSPRPRASSPRRRAPTPSAPRLTKRWCASRPAKRKSSPSISPATATSTHLHSRSGSGASVMAYEAYHHGQLEDYEYPQAAVDETRR